MEKVRVDPRAKLLFSLAVVVTAVAVSDPIILLYLWLLLIPVTLWCRVGAAELTRRLLLVFPFAGFLAIWQPFFHEGTVLFTVWGVSGTVEGAVFGLLLFLRVLIALTALPIFVATSTDTEIAATLNWFRVPPVLTATMLMTLRYISLIGERRKKIQEAQASRLFTLSENPAGARWVIRTIGHSVAHLFILSYEQGERAYESMLARGYQSKTREITLDKGIYSPKSSALMWLLTFVLPGCVFLLWAGV